MLVNDQQVESFAQAFCCGDGTADRHRGECGAMERDNKVRPAAGSRRGTKVNRSRSGSPAPTPGNRGQIEACQDRVLDEWQRHASTLEVCLRNGTRTRGVLTGVGSFVMAFEARDGLCLVYKQAILTIMPAGARTDEEAAKRRPLLTLKGRNPLA
jgi:RNA chaperone Hfq